MPDTLEPAMTETEIPQDVRERAEHFAMECGHPWLAPVFWRCIMADRASRAPDRDVLVEAPTQAAPLSPRDDQP